MSKNREIPLKLEGVTENIYAGFGVRFIAFLLDCLILAPIYVFAFYLSSLHKNVYLFLAIPELILSFWFGIYLVKRYGATPGKLINGFQIIKIDGSEVSWKEAILRYSGFLFLSIFYMTINCYAHIQADNIIYKELDWVDRQTYIDSLIPNSITFYDWVIMIWITGGLITLIFNKRKQALHDIIAGTVVVRKKYIPQIRAEISSRINYE